MKRPVTILICAVIPMIISTILKMLLKFSDNVMISIYFIMFGTLFLISKKKGWL